MSELTPYWIWWPASGLATLVVCAWLAQRRQDRRLAAALLCAQLLIAALSRRAAESGAERKQLELQHTVEGFGPIYAAELERLGHARVGPDTPPDDPTYLQLIEAQKRWLAGNPAVADVYTFRRLPDGTVVLVVDSETDYDRNGRIEGEREARTPIGEVYEAVDDGLRRALAGTSTFTPEPVTDRWGTWVSAFVPMQDSAGRVEAVLGIDYPAESWVNNANAERTRVLSVAALVQALLLGSGILLAVTRRNLERHARSAAELRDACARAEAASETKGRFLATMSHEIRTPLNGVLGMNELLLGTELSAEQRRFADAIRASGSLLLGAINDILDFSKNESHALEITEAACDLRAVLAEVGAAFADPARARGLTLELRAADDVAPGHLADAQRIRQVLTNLLGNAVKFTESGGVAVELRSLGPAGAGRETLEFRVRDTGIGIPAASRQRIFEPFAQADDSITRRFGGTGLGLAISRQLVERMGGEIDFESAVGAGSTFWLRLALRTLAAAAAPAAAEAPVPAAHLPRFPDLSVLLVEDNEVNQSVARAMLERLGCRVQVVGDGDRAVEVGCAGGFDLVLMDLHLPGMDGLTATAEIRRLRGECELPAGSRLAIVALTADLTPEVRARGRDVGMDDWLGKPLRLRDLAGALARACPDAAREPEKCLQPAHAAGSEAELDPAALEHLRELGRELGTDVLGQVARAFCASAPALLADLQRGLEQGSVDAVRRAAHTLKSSGAHVGATRVASLARELEEQGRGGELFAARALAARLEQALGCAREALEQLAGVAR